MALLKENSRAYNRSADFLSPLTAGIVVLLVSGAGSSALLVTLAYNRSADFLSPLTAGIVVLVAGGAGGDQSA